MEENIPSPKKVLFVLQLMVSRENAWKGDIKYATKLSVSSHTID